jgi:hypothetical protein
MPAKGKPQSKKSINAQKRGAEALKAAIEKMELGAEDAPEFYSVQKVLGNAYFVIRNAWGVEFQGQAGHGGGKARISVGQIVLAAGSSKPSLPREILAVIDDRKQAAALVKAGLMAPTIVSAAQGAGSVSTGGAPVEEDGYVFADEGEEGGEGEGEVDVEAL